jgi:DNA-binding transcriptional regulator LsrR (DeoR family)
MSTTSSPPTEERLRLIACALLRSQGFSQTEISQRIGLSQPEVSRILQTAVTKNLLWPHPTFLRDSVGADELKQAEAIYGKEFDDVQTRVQSIVHRGVDFRLHVVSATDLNTFCEQAARHVADLLAHGPLTVGTMWGFTSDKIIEFVGRYARPSRGREFRAIPLAGDPLHLINQDNQVFSGSALAGKLETAFTGGKRPDLPSLNGVPAYISKALMSDKKKASVLWDFIRNIPGYKRIFGKGGYVHDLDTVLTGVGVMAINPVHTATFIREREAQEGPAFEKARPYILGDFAGWVLPRPGLKAPASELVAELNQGWTGISLEQLKHVAAKTKSKSAPGVIAVAFGTEDKSGILRETIKRGLINHLIVDEKLAGQLVESA